ncbi:hypothetical protein [Aeromonas caviae]|uniref:hypothetical protein n=1 Tax=Aeromonas caviae TaxID=648 RepID=UPI0029DB0FFA|nr:hypothetical protein [Aeromonas caviae]MDX7857229.1 hypothetical protein [Aeromonas caviae]
MAKIIILDTSFLIEFFAIPVDSTPEGHQRAYNCFCELIDKNYDIYVPLSVVYELANHIIDIKNPQKRTELAQSFTALMQSAWTERTPFTIIPCTSDGNLELTEINLIALCESYSMHIDEGLSLTDCTIIDAAIKIKKSYRERKRNWPAHILTLHMVLKAHEPDSIEAFGF